MITKDTPTKSEFDKAFYCLFENGDLTAIANSMGHTPEYASQMYSVNSDRKSNLYRAFRDLRALREHNMERGEKALALFIEFVTRGLEPECLSVEAESLRLKKEVDDWETAAMSDAPASKVIQEVRDIELQAGRTLDAYNGQELRQRAAQTIENRARKNDR